MNGNKKVKISFVKGFFDADGSYRINQKKHDYRVRFGQVDKQVIVNLKTMLENLGFETSQILGPYQYKEIGKPYYEVQMHGKSQVLKFNTMIKPCHPNKKLDEKL